MSIAVIPARGGSKRIPRKNIREFCGKPMIAWTIETAIESRLFERIIVSTDENEIADISAKYGAEIPFARPDELSNDHATTREVMRHAAEFLDGDEPLCCLYATAPFIQQSDLVEGSEILTNSENKKRWDYVFSATQFSFPIQRALRKKDDQTITMFEPDHELTRSQDLEPAFHDAGQFYWGTSHAFKNELPIFSSNSTIVNLPNWRVQDIDTEDDWRRAEAMFKALGLDQT